MDKELFELCRDVYERTEWDDINALASYGIRDVPNLDTSSNPFSSPIYTSDYLLEKLPAYQFSQPDYEERLCLYKEAHEFVAEYAYIHAAKADTPLKALLKLVIALDDTGELK